MAKFIKFLFPDFRFGWIAEETKKNLPIELDFRIEAQNIEKIRRMLGKHSFVKIPHVYQQYSSSRVLTMEYCEGRRADDLAFMKQNRIDPNKVNLNILQCV
mgnify:CR=1 FL=1